MKTADTRVRTRYLAIRPDPQTLEVFERLRAARAAAIGMPQVTVADLLRHLIHEAVRNMAKKGK